MAVLVFDDRETVDFEYMKALLFRNTGKSLRGKNRYFEYNCPATFEFSCFNCVAKSDNELIIFNEQIKRKSKSYKDSITLDRRYIIDIKYENLDFELLYIEFPAHSISLSIT